MSLTTLAFMRVAFVVLVAASFAQVAGAAPDSTYVRVRSVSSTIDGATQLVTFDVVRVGDTPLILAGHKMTVRDRRGRERIAVLDADSDGSREATVIAYSNVYYPEDDDSDWDNIRERLWLPPRFLPVDGGTLTIGGMDEWSFGPLPPDGSTLNRDGTITPLFGFDRMMLQLRVREYHHAGMDHYLLTANAAEFDALDSGDVPGWRPTGVTFWGWATKASQQFVPVCRLLFLYPSGYSHFMSSFANECAALASSGAAILETSDAFYMAASDGASCPNVEIVYFGAKYYSWPSYGSPIYRLWNGKAEANHRYVIDKATRDAMVARGWVSEGAGPEGVVMCGYVSTEFN